MSFLEGSLLLAVVVFSLDLCTTTVTGLGAKLLRFEVGDVEFEVCRMLLVAVAAVVEGSEDVDEEEDEEDQRFSEGEYVSV